MTAAKSKKFEETTKKLNRLLSILRILDSRERCTPQSLSAKFGTTERNIYRDINTLNGAGFSIYFDRETATYSFTDTDFTLRDLNLTRDELMALLVGRQMASRVGKPFEKSFLSILKKAKKDTNSHTEARVKGLEGECRFWIDIDDAESFAEVERQYKLLNEAFDKKVDVEIVYSSMRTEKETTRVVSPYGLVFNYGLWYVLGYCHLRKATRVFALDRIIGIRLTDSHYDIPAEFNIAEYFKPGWQMRRCGKPVEVVLEFTKEYARWVKRRKWHPTQLIDEQEDGSIIFRVTVQGTQELKWWIYHWIPYCKVLSPPELRDEMIREMGEMLKQYGQNI